MTQSMLACSIMSMFTSLMAHCGHIKYCILRHQKTRSHHNKRAISIPPTQTSQIIHLLVPTTSSEYLLILVGLVMVKRGRRFKGVSYFEAKF